MLKKIMFVLCFIYLCEAKFNYKLMAEMAAPENAEKLKYPSFNLSLNKYMKAYPLLSRTRFLDDLMISAYMG